MLSRFCLSLGMESDSVFHDLFPGRQPMPVLQSGLPIPSLNALPVHRANQVDLGAIWRTFYGHFGDLFRKGGIFKDMCFISVKQYFLRFGRVLDRDFSVLRF